MLIPCNVVDADAIIYHREFTKEGVKRMKQSYKPYLAILLMGMMLCLLPACNASPGAVDSEDNMDEIAQRVTEGSDFDDSTYNNEQEGAEYTEKKAEESEFIGNWEAASDRAAYLYGNLNLQIKQDGTWKANITEEDFNGTWKYNGTGITLSSEIINCDLFYTDDGVLNFRDADYPEDILVLTPVK